MVSAWGDGEQAVAGSGCRRRKSNEMRGNSGTPPGTGDLRGIRDEIDAIRLPEGDRRQPDPRGRGRLRLRRRRKPAPTLYEQVEGAIDEALEQDAKDVDEHQTVEKKRLGRREDQDVHHLRAGVGGSGGPVA